MSVNEVLALIGAVFELLGVRPHIEGFIFFMLAIAGLNFLIGRR